jgi:DNA-3-methyladenine glycosylase
VRALEPLEGIDLMRQRRRLRSARDTDLTNGPGKLCLALGITGEHNRVPLDEPPLVIRRGVDVSREAVTITPRVGISRSADWPLRWFVTDSPFVSKTPSAVVRRRPDR